MTVLCVDCPGALNDSHAYLLGYVGGIIVFLWRLKLKEKTKFEFTYNCDYDSADIARTATDFNILTGCVCFQHFQIPQRSANIG